MTEQEAQQTDPYHLGVETLLKVTAGNDHRLSDMADNKAQIITSSMMHNSLPSL
jgi:hypothetical protein